ncbi:hypothetical protein L195_g061558, partial [Trifolium pratense]
GLSIPDRRPSPLLARSKCSTGAHQAFAQRTGQVRHGSPPFAQRTALDNNFLLIVLSALGHL